MKVVKLVEKEVEEFSHTCDMCGVTIERLPSKGCFYVEYRYGHPKDGDDEWIDLCQHCSTKLLDELKGRGVHINTFEEENSTMSSAG